MIKYVSHDFYCIQCGQKIYPLMRKKGTIKKKFHRKRLYCPYCKQEINCIEIRNDAEEFEFKEAFENGDFKEEAQESARYIKGELL